MKLPAVRRPSQSIQFYSCLDRESVGVGINNSALITQVSIEPAQYMLVMVVLARTSTPNCDWAN